MGFILPHWGVPETLPQKLEGTTRLIENHNIEKKWPKETSFIFNPLECVPI